MSDNFNTKAAQTDINNMQQSITATQAQMQSVKKAAEEFTNQINKTEGKVQKANRTMAHLMDGLVKKQAEYLKNEQKVLKLTEELVAAKEEEEALVGDLKVAQELKVAKLKEELRQHQLIVDTSKQEVKHHAEAISNLGKQKSLWGSIVSHVTGNTKELIASLTITRQLTKGLQGVAQAARDVNEARILSGSYKGMSGNFFADMKTNLKDAFEYSTQLSKAQTKLALLGISADETASSMKQFSLLAPEDISRQNAMTEATGALSKMLGVSLGDATEFVIEQSQKYNQTAEHSVTVMKDLQTRTEGLNSGMSKTVFVGRDVTKVLFDISRESQAVAQDQKMLQSTIAKNVMGLQAGGRSYQQAMKSSGDLAKLMTTEAPKWAQVMGGNELQKELMSNVNFAAKGVTNEFEQSIEDAAPGMVQKLKDIQARVGKDMTQYGANQQMMSELSQTSLGYDAQMKVWYDNIASKPNAELAVEQMTGKQGVEAADFVKLIRQHHDLKELMTLKLDAQGTEEAWKTLSDKVGEISTEEKDLIANVLKGREREAYLRDKMAKKDKDAITKNEEVQAASRAKALDNAKKNLALAKASGNAASIKYHEDKIKEYQDPENKNLKDTATEAIKKQAGAGAMGGGIWGALKTGLFGTTTGQVTTGLGGAGALWGAKTWFSQSNNVAAKMVRDALKGITNTGVEGVEKSAAKALFKGAGSGALKGALGSGLAGLGIDAVTGIYSDTDKISKDYNEKGFGEAALTTAKSGTKNMGLFSTALGIGGGALGGVLGGGIGAIPGAVAGGWLGSQLDDFLGTRVGNLYEDKGNAVENAKTLDTSMMDQQNASNQKTATFGQQNVQAGSRNVAFTPFQRNGGWDIEFRGVIPFADTLNANLEVLT